LLDVFLPLTLPSLNDNNSNWWCSLFNASLALSVGMTSVSSLLSIGLLPANLMLYGWLAYGVVLQGDEINIVAALDFGAIFITLGVVMGAIISGLYVSYKYDNATFHRRANHVGSVSGITLILFSAFLGSGVDGAETNFWSLPWSFYIGTAFPCVLGMSLANIVARSFTLPYPEIVAISIECCYQNTAIATSVAVTMFSNPTERAEAVSVPLFYGIVEAVVIGLYCIWAWKAGWTKAPPDEKVKNFDLFIRCQ
jgi:predicted Na+-dependent transporter